MTKKRIALLVDAFPPLRSSGAVQLRDLARQLVLMGCAPTVFVPSADLDQPHEITDYHGVRVFRFRSLRTKDVGRVRRALAEISLSFVLLRRLNNSTLRSERWDGVVFYSPTIFLGYASKRLSAFSRCRSYLIIRDIFPEWAVDMGVMGRGLAFRFFKLWERYQYRAADTVGVQSPANLEYYEFANLHETRLEVLHNWLQPPPAPFPESPVEIPAEADSPVIVYAGNMGVAQDLGAMLALAERMQHKNRARFVFVGRGSEKEALERTASARRLENVSFHSEIDPDAIWSLYSAADLGIVSLSPALTTHNIPGKFLSYMFGGLPVFARINAGNDLEAIINDHEIGICCVSDEAAEIDAAFLEAIRISRDSEASDRCRALAAAMFSAESAAAQIMASLGLDPVDGGPTESE
ncbi:MAG: glycosyltransferase family 4 protein [Pseudomonadota bacterium]